MGVWHVGGMGLPPGSVTVPLTYIYLLLKASTKGDEKARMFFETSGERTEEVKGAPESVIIFTSKEVISGEKDGKEWEQWGRTDVRDEWFNTRKQSSAPKTIARYLSSLFDTLKDDDFTEFYGGEWIKEMFFVELKHEDFMDCFAKIGVTLSALRDKEVWANMVGGTNQINSALLTVGSFSAVVGSYYYVFQSQPNIRLLHPEICKPNFNNPTEYVSECLNRWHELPIFHLELGSIVKKLSELFHYREKVNVKEIEKSLESLGYPTKYLAKIRGRLTRMDGDVASRGYMLDALRDMIEEIEKLGIANFSQWKDWARNEKILWKLRLDGACEKVE